MALSVVFILVMVVSSTTVTGDSCIQSSYGKEFVFGFVNLKYHESRTEMATPVLELRVMTQNYRAQLEISIPSRSSANKDTGMETHRQTVYGYRELQFNASFLNEKSNDSIGGAIKVTADNPISLVAMYNIGPYVVAPQILPTNVLTNNYIIPSFPPNPIYQSNAEILIISLNDSTNVEIHGYALSGHRTSLNAMQTYIYQASKDPSSVSISSNKPVAVFSSFNMGDTSRYHSTLTTRHSPMSIQVPPIDANAFHFIVPAITLDRSISTYVIRLFSTGGAHVDIHTSSTHAKHVHLFNEIFYEMNSRSSDTIEIFSDKPIMVVQYVMHGSNAMLMVPIPAVSQYMTSYLAIDAESYDGRNSQMHDYYTIIVPEEEATGLLVENQPLVHNIEQVAHRSPKSNYTVITVRMSNNHAAVKHVENVQFGLFVYGFDTDFYLYAYAHAAGMNFNVSDCAGNHDIQGNIIG